METDSNCTIDNEIHLEYFLFFVIYDILIIFVAEVARFKAKCNIIKELALLIFLRIEEEAEVIEHIVEEVMDDYTSFDRTWQSIDKIIIFLDL